jgi:hypothetical protein
MELPVLHAIIQNDDIRLKLRDGDIPAVTTIAGNDHRRPWEGLREVERLIPRPFRIIDAYGT